MSTISLRLPESLHKRVREVAAQEDISINQFITTALAEKLSALLTAEYIDMRARRGSKRRFRKALSKVKAIEPESKDKIEK